MTTRREYLIQHDMAKPGRGKFSGAALSFLDNARAKGVKFSDDEPKPVPVKRDKPTASVTKDDGYGEIVYTYPENLYRAREVVSGKVRSMRAVCNTCRVSLVGHGCANPSIVATDGSGSVVVKIERV